MPMSVNVSGIEAEIAKIGEQYNRDRGNIFNAAQEVGVFLDAETQKRAPVETGELVSTITHEVTDKGRGRGFLIEVSAGNTKYAYKMHEGIYNAHDHHHMNLNSMVTIRKVVKGLKGVSAFQRRKRYQKTVRGMFWYDSQGNKHGRKYLTRAWDENRERVFAWLESAPNVTSTFDTGMGGKSSPILGGSRTVKSRPSWANFRARAK